MREDAFAALGNSGLRARLSNSSSPALSSMLIVCD
jgi:hypothetical protein